MAISSAMWLAIKRLHVRRTSAWVFIGLLVALLAVVAMFFVWRGGPPGPESLARLEPPTEEQRERVVARLNDRGVTVELDG